MTPFLKNKKSLEELLQSAPASGVVLNHSWDSAEDESLPMRDVLNGVLEGRTYSFTALVGFFGHRSTSSISEAEDNPADIILREAREEKLGADEDFQAGAFRLGVGVNSSRAAQDASRLWYWLCRFRHEAQEGQEQTDALRAWFLDMTATEGFVVASRKLWRQLCGSGATGTLAFGADDFVKKLNVHEKETSRAIEEALQKTLAPLKERTNDDAAAILLGFFLQRRADFRINPQESKYEPIFHPKLYVVERGDSVEDGQTVSIVGSHNWTEAAMGTSTTQGALRSNIEVATIHVDQGHLASADIFDKTSTLGARVCETANYLFRRMKYILGSWDEASRDGVLPAGKLLEATKTTIPEDGQFKEAELPPAFKELLSYLRHLVADLSQINLDKHHDKFFDRFSLTSDYEAFEPLFGGKIPANYQTDGAVRLLSIFERGSRGAFLTDEPGLGKTLTAVMSMAIMAATKLSKRREYQEPLRLSIIVPAALRGEEGKPSRGEAPTGWHLHAREIREAVEALLKDVFADISDDEAARLTSEEHFQIQVISHGRFSPAALPDAERSELDDPDVFDDEKHHGYLDTFEFIASSELVLIDESHTFRNQTSRQTRTLRLLLTLPLPGEQDWQIIPPGEPDEKLKESPSADFPDDISRRLLFLSATPFNNHIDDLITQIGHFAQYQDWAMPYATLGGGARLKEKLQGPLNDAIHHWQTTSDEELRRDAFRRIVQYARRHLYRTRSLSIPPDQEKKKDLDRGDKLRARYDDLGPEYRWAGQDQDYLEAFASALEWLNAEEQGKSDDKVREALELKKFDAQQNLEAVLTSLFVQRSRIRALRIIEAAAGSKSKSLSSSQMFRKPRRPRHPLAINRHHRGDEEASKESLEATILGGLFKLLFPTEETIKDGPSARLLTMKAYEISALRGQKNVQVVRNAIGFQVTNLIKRLQSSPYAFFRTLIRGIFRRSLFELSLVEQLLHDQEAQWPEDFDKEKLAQSLAEMKGGLNRYRLRSLPNVVILMGGTHVEYSELSFHLLSGIDYQKGASKQGTNEAKEVVEIYNSQLLPGLLEADEQGELNLGSEGAEGSDEQGAQQGWIARLLDDASRGEESELYRDIISVLDWAEELVPAIWGYGHEAGMPFEKLWKENFLKETPQFQNPSGWLFGRINKDERARTLMAWLLIQAAARQGVQEKNIEDYLRAGIKTLIFTEYKDTQDYLLALFGALHLVFRSSEKPPAGTKVEELRQLLVTEMQAVAGELDEQAQFVAAQEKKPYHYADPKEFISPITDGAQGWLARWAEAVEADPALFSAVVDELSQTFVRVYGDEADRLIRDELITPVDEDQELRLNKTFEAQVDSFSPWYQLEPDPKNKDEAESYLLRLNQAAVFPVHTMLTTDVLAEGVNLQECGVVVHYDLPWNPTRLIQRNGRIDRRLNPSFEDEQQRAELHQALIHALDEKELSDKALERTYRSPAYIRPEQVYHLSVLPVEPTTSRAEKESEKKSEEESKKKQNALFVERVRRSLQTKLEAIQTLFGLANWPVVLTHEDTQEVLTGELDFETPGFRRREDLFASLRQLEDRAKTAGELYKGPQQNVTLAVHVPESARKRLIRLFAADDDPEVNQAWEQVIAAGIVSWTKDRPVARPVRSDADWSAAAKNQEGVIAGVLLLKDEDAYGGVSLLTWGAPSDTGAYDTSRRIVPALLRPSYTGSGEEGYDLEGDLYIADLARLRPLSNWREILSAVPTTPSELADDIIKIVLDTAADGQLLKRGDEYANTPFPVHDIQDVSNDALISLLKETSFLNIVLGADSGDWAASPAFSGALFVYQSKAASEDRPEPSSPAVNLWLVFDHDQESS